MHGTIPEATHGLTLSRLSTELRRLDRDPVDDTVCCVCMARACVHTWLRFRVVDDEALSAALLNCSREGPALCKLVLGCDTGTVSGIRCCTMYGASVTVDAAWKAWTAYSRSNHRCNDWTKETAQVRCNRPKSRGQPEAWIG